MANSGLNGRQVAGVEVSYQRHISVGLGGHLTPAPGIHRQQVEARERIAVVLDLLEFLRRQRDARQLLDRYLLEEPEQRNELIELAQTPARLFGTDGVRGRVGIDLTEDVVRDVGAAFGAVLME